ncbi:MAG TPA: JAB domain-containing protein [Polyangiaceae bacterium]|nr:JAB domain-containing protein [Polyangiaceae bacterium]
MVSRLQEVVCETPRFEHAYGTDVRDATTVAKIIRPLLKHEAVEVFVVLLLNGQHRVFGLAEVSRGTLTATLVHPREVFGPALRHGAAAIIVAHNHPSGDPEPSTEDVTVTQRLVEAGTILGIPLLDHVIVGERDRHLSLRIRLGLGL